MHRPTFNMNARTMRVTKQPSEEIEGRRPERKTGRLDPVRKEEEVGREDPARAWGVQIFCFH